MNSTGWLLLITGWAVAALVAGWWRDERDCRKKAEADVKSAKEETQAMVELIGKTPDDVFAVLAARKWQIEKAVNGYSVNGQFHIYYETIMSRPLIHGWLVDGHYHESLPVAWKMACVAWEARQKMEAEIAEVRKAAREA